MARLTKYVSISRDATWSFSRQENNKEQLCGKCTIKALNAIQKVKRKLCQKVTGLMFIDALDAEQCIRIYDVADKTQFK